MKQKGKSKKDYLQHINVLVPAPIRELSLSDKLNAVIANQNIMSQHTKTLSDNYAALKEEYEEIQLEMQAIKEKLSKRKVIF